MDRLRPELTGTLTIANNGWRSPHSWLISFSESGKQQEAMLLLAAYGWIESELGRFVLETETARPWVAHLMLTAGPQE